MNAVIEITKAQLEAVSAAHRGLAQDYWLGKLNWMDRAEISDRVKEITNNKKLSLIKSVRLCHAYLYITQEDAIWSDYAESGMQELDLEIDYVIER